MAPLKHLVAVAMVGLVLLAASMSTDGAALPTITSSDVDAVATADGTPAVARVGAATAAATAVEGPVGTNAAADEGAPALDGASDRTYTHVASCVHFRVVKVCKHVTFVCHKRFAVHTLAAPHADGGAVEAEAPAAGGAVDAAARAAAVDATSRTYLVYHKRAIIHKPVVVHHPVVVHKPAICTRLVCKHVKKCIVFHH